MYEYVFIFYNNYFQILKIEMSSLLLFSFLMLSFATGSVFSAPALNLGSGTGSGDDTYTGKPVAVSPPMNRTENPIAAQEVPTVKKTDKERCDEDPSMVWDIVCVETKYNHIKNNYVCVKKDYRCVNKPRDTRDTRDTSGSSYAFLAIIVIIAIIGFGSGCRDK